MDSAIDQLRRKYKSKNREEDLRGRETPSQTQSYRTQFRQIPKNKMTEEDVEVAKELEAAHVDSILAHGLSYPAFEVYH